MSVTLRIVQPNPQKDRPQPTPQPTHQKPPAPQPETTTKAPAPTPQNYPKTQPPLATTMTAQPSPTLKPIATSQTQNQAGIKAPSTPTARATILTNPPAIPAQMLLPTPAKTFPKTQSKTKINRSKTTAELNTKALATTKAHLFKNPALLPIIPVLNKLQIPLPTVTETASPNPTANTAQAMQLITATAKTIGGQNQLQTLAILAAPEVLSTTVQLKFKAKPTGIIAATATVPPTLTAGQKPKSINPILRISVAAVSLNITTAATTIQ